MKKYFKNKNTLALIFGFLGLYLVTTGVVWVLASYVFNGKSSVNPENLKGLDLARSKISEELPKTEECPINGKMFTTVERDIWQERRPLAAVIENHAEARPLEGLSRADVVYEAIAESGVTRNLGIFYCGISEANARLAPVRSARVHLIKWAAGYGENPIFLHIGGANNFCTTCPGGVKPKGDIAPEVNAYALLDKLGWANGRSGNDMDGERNVGIPVVKRDRGRLGTDDLGWEHTVVAFSDEVFKEAASRGFGADYKGTAWDQSFTQWKFQDGIAVSSPDASKISFEFWANEPDYTVEWTYNPASNSYSRINGGKKVVDLSNNNKEITATNIVVMFVKEKRKVDNEHHVYTENVGTGEALIFQNGTVLKGTWEKKAIETRTIFTDESGEEVRFVRGPIWIEGVPLGNDVVYN